MVTHDDVRKKWKEKGSMTSAGSYTESHAVALVRYGINFLQKLQVDKKHFYALNRVNASGFYTES